MFLTIEKGRVVALSAFPAKKWPIDSVEDLHRLLEKRGETEYTFSSSLDFPEEHTGDPEVIALCETLRGGSWDERMSRAIEGAAGGPEE